MTGYVSGVMHDMRGTAYQSGLVSRCSLLLDLHGCAGRSEDKPRSHASSVEICAYQFRWNIDAEMAF